MQHCYWFTAFLGRNISIGFYVALDLLIYRIIALILWIREPDAEHAYSNYAFQDYRNNHTINVGTTSPIVSQT